MKVLTSVLACSLLFLSGCGDQNQDTAETEPMFDQNRSTAETDRETPQTREPTDMGAMESEPPREDPGTTMQDTDEGMGDTTQTP